MTHIHADKVSSHEVTVSLGAIVRDGLIFLSRRKHDVHQGGLWEFPGGKQEQGESSLMALQRELDEELGIKVRGCRPLIQITHEYSGLSVRLDVWLVTEFDGEPAGCEGQKTAWVPIADLSNYPFPEANRSIITALQLPDCYAITPDLQALSGMKTAVDHLVNSGYSLIQFRAPSLKHDDWYEAARYAIQAGREHGGEAGVRVVLNSSLQTALELEADGVHLNARRLASGLAVYRGLLPKGFLVGASCHNQTELMYAAGEKADFAVLSPVLPTLSHPGEAALGWPCFTEWVSGCGLPVYALGGMRKEYVQQSREAGGQGVAGISLFSGE